jgi:hypothetical protein
VEAAVDQVFADPALQEGLTASHLSLDDLLRLFELYVARAFQALMDFFEAIHDASPLLYYGLLGALLVILGLLLWHIAYTVGRAFRGAADGDAEATSDSPQARARRYQDLVAEAERLSQGGDHTQATRSLLLALLALLAEERVLRVARSWTLREVVQRLEGLGADSLDLARLRAAGEAALYGDGSITPEEYRRCAEAVREVARRSDDLRAQGAGKRADRATPRAS